MMLNSEEDVRSKIVIPWLIANGFDLSNISLEFSFKLKVGRGIREITSSCLLENPTVTPNKSKHSSITSRSDILVRNHESKNLLIIEVKALDKSLDDNDRDQAISYARLLLEGNIAPFTVLTNGQETKIFDSVTKEQINGQTFSADHEFLKKNYQFSGDDLLLRNEALQTFVSLSPGNLIAFCKAQVEYRMKLLKSDDLNSGKKYIPQLYIERDEEKQKLHKLLDVENKRVTVIVGSPQVGKTNFVCHRVNERIVSGLPCIFYPAIGLKRSLLEEIAEDFEWEFGGYNSSNYTIISKLRNVLRRLNQSLVIFIDGWNEANIELAHNIDDECQRLSCNEIQIVISLTNMAAKRLLGGYGGNPSHVAEAANIESKSVGLIEASPDLTKSNPDWNLVYMERYKPEETDKAYEIYSEAYKVTVPETHQKAYEPYTLGVAMRLYQSIVLPDTLDEPDLLEKILNEKFNRAVNLQDYNLHNSLGSLANEIFENDSPVKLETLSRIWNFSVAKNVSSSFFEAALLAPVTNGENLPSIDFYYGKERDYVICYWAKRWVQKIINGIDLSAEFSQAGMTNAGSEALGWFFKQPKHIELILENYSSLPVYENPRVRRILISSLCDIADRHKFTNELWLQFAYDRILNDEDNFVRIEGVRLAALLSDDRKQLEEVFEKSKSWRDLIVALLTINEEYPFRADEVGEIVLSALQSIHWSAGDQESGESEITDILKDLLNENLDNSKEPAAACFGYIAPHAFLKYLSELIRSNKFQEKRELLQFEDGILNASSGLGESYYGEMCPGQLHWLRDEPESLKEEYEMMKEILEPVIATYPSKESVRRLMNLLVDLKPPKSCSQENENDESEPFIDLYTLPLPFENNESE